MSKKTTIEDAIALLGFAVTPNEKKQSEDSKKEAASPRSNQLFDKVVYTQSEAKKMTLNKQKRF